ncbi:glucan 1,3-beta-glucosidase GLUC78 precursor [Microdochium bolleyi]|uniref:Glucan 1,3-beta-glucosidase GLUC78 n=1 Tax=Microdochium bolleyi TaxID=196109 RepID=A0A136JB43_9PEZI|nr:glucan 1,3-beta-glucosidase GLUC78 precursor [Microdochium bolleyi]
MGLSKLIAASLLVIGQIAASASAIPATDVQVRQAAGSSYWFSSIKRQGVAVFGEQGHTVYRNIKDFGAVGDGVTDDTDAINKAIQSGPNRCIDECDSRTNAPALVYFPPGTYLVSKPIVQTYYTQFVGDAINIPVLKAAASFQGMAVIDANPYYPNQPTAKNWYINQNNFFRQIRNFVIDITAVPMEAGCGIHWQVSQATSLQNILFKMNPDTSEKNGQKGLFIENGSGGFMTDLTFNGGGTGINMGSQQYTLRNMTFNNCRTAIHFIWNWQILLQDFKINNCQVGVDMTAFDLNSITVGSLIVQDTVIANTPIGIKTLYKPENIETNNTLILDNVDMSQGVPTAIQNAKDKTVVLNGNQHVAMFAQGKQYSGTAGKAVQGVQKAISKPKGLMSNGKIFTRTKPQYEGVPASRFISVKSAGAKGDGKSDDTQAIQKIFNAAKEGDIIYFDHGAYLIMDTVKIPKNIKITGEMWPLIMATGSKFGDESKPIPMFQVGEPGDVGTVEMSDLMIETKGPAPGAILMQWNLEGSNPGDAGLWDVHFRVGGTSGTDLQSDKCRKTPTVDTKPNPECVGSFMMLHITTTASVYVENCWFWVADHELDLTDWSQINIYNGRGVLIESQKPVWLWGTASEHSQLHNYQVTNAKNLYMGVIQTETAYMQGNPDATVPFKANDGFFDPNFAQLCDGSSQRCARTLGLRITNSSDIFLFGGGLYSFFDNYGQKCVNENNCQDDMITIENSSVHLFGVATKAAIKMITHNGKTVALDKDNRNTFCAAIAMFETSDGPGSSSAISNGPTLTTTSTRTSTIATTVGTSTVTNGNAGGGGGTGAAPTSAAATQTGQYGQPAPSGTNQPAPNPVPTGGAPSGGNNGQLPSASTIFPGPGPAPTSAPAGNGVDNGAGNGGGNPAPTPAPTSAPAGNNGGNNAGEVIVTVTETMTVPGNCGVSQ